MADQNIKYRVSTTGTEKAASKFGKLAVAIGAAFGIRQIFRFAQTSVEAFKIQEIAVAKLEAAYGKSTLGLQRYASELQKITAFGDESIIVAESLIATFVKEESQVKALTKASLDFAAAKAVDLSVAADLITKTFASSTNALSRYGLEVKGAALSSDRLSSILQALSVFTGQAEKQAKTLTGALQQQTNEIGDLQEEIGQQLIPAWLLFQQVINQTLKSVVTMVKAFSELFSAGEGKRFIEIEITTIGQALTTKQLEGQIKAIKELRKAGKDVRIGPELQIQIDKFLGSTKAVIGEVKKIQLEIDGLKGSLKDPNISLLEFQKTTGDIIELENLLKGEISGINTLLKEGNEFLFDRIKLLEETNRHFRDSREILLQLTKDTFRRGEPAFSPLDEIRERIEGGAGEETAFLEGLEEDMEGVGRDVFVAWNTILSSEMITAWEDIFGEANSLFEKLIKDMAALLLSDVFSSLFALITGPAGGSVGGVLGFIGDLFGSNVPDVPGGSPNLGDIPGGSPNLGNVPNQTIQINIGDIPFAQAVVNANGVISQRRLIAR